MQGSASFTAGKVGQAFSFDSVSASFVLIPDAPNLDLGSTFSIEAWVNPGDCDGGLAGLNPVLTKGSNTSFESYGIALFDSEWRYVASASGGGWNVELTGGSCIPGTWYHLVATQDGSTARLFVNGAEVDSEPAAFAPLNSPSPLIIGERDDLFSHMTHYFNGIIDEVSIYDRALTPFEIQGLFEAGSAGKCARAIPTLSNWGAIIFGSLLLAMIVFYICRGKHPAVVRWQGN